MTKLKYYLEKAKRIYTLKEKHKNQSTLDAHYKYIKIKSVKEKNYLAIIK